ncbi:MAG: epoxyqueuosine reductase QueH [Lachnospiraceae bacterium]|nr:epoxyqueuosine reductase QueH [Lachnospiraceae bacterium]
MTNRNYQKELDEILKRLEGTPKLLIHSCCAPCSSYVLEYLSEYFSITDLFYNPNIDKKAEYDKRLQELERLISNMPFKNPVTLMPGRYETIEFYDAVKGFEKEPERGKRCEICFRLRLTEAAKAARETGADYFTTTLSISPLKDAELLNTIGEELAAEYGVKYLPSDFKKRNGYKRSIELSKEYDLYRQDYCGCIFSYKERHPEGEE